MRSRLFTTAFVLSLGVLFRQVCVAQAPELGADPPNATPTPGPTVGSYSLGNIESVNSVSGTLGINIPVAQLPPGPGGFTGGVNLVYSSAIYDVQTEAVIGPPFSTMRMLYQPSTHGGGWKYNFKYTLWSQTRISVFNSVTCSVVSTAQAKAWYKTLLQTPDGSNHILHLVGGLDKNGNTQDISSLSTDPAQAYYAVDFSGNTNHNCGINVPKYDGTLVFATADASYIRVEANTQANIWTAYFPEGTQVSGPIVVLDGHAADSEASQITDRNGNTLAITRSCAPGSPCVEVVQDNYQRSIAINYGSDTAGTWTDTIKAPGPNGTVTTTVNWRTAPVWAIPYYCFSYGDGTTLTSGTCNLGTNQPSVVTSVQLPPASPNGNATIFLADYSPLDNQTYSWGELHALIMCTGINPSACQPQWDVHYRYKFDNLASLPARAAAERAPGTPINPLSSKVQGHSEYQGGASTALKEATSYMAGSLTSAYNYPALGVGMVGYPTGSYTNIVYPQLGSPPNQDPHSEVMTTNLCPSTLKSRDLCVPVPYRITHPDGSQTEYGWASNTAPPGVPAGAPFNPYIRYSVHTPPYSTYSKVSSVELDQNGNATTLKEYGWVGWSDVDRTGNGGIMVRGVSGTPARTTTITYYESNPALPYWSAGAARNLRSKKTVTVRNAAAQLVAQTDYTYENALTSAKLRVMERWDSTTGNKVATSWTYLGNGNVETQTDPDNHETRTLYDNAGLCPTSITIASQRTTTYAWKQYTDPISNTTACNGYLDQQTDQQNALTTSYTYDDTGRVLTVREEGRAGLSRTARTSYDDVNLVVTTTQDDTPSQSLVTTTYYDALGRVQAAVDGIGNRIEKAYRYGSGVTYELVSNPYLNASDPSMGWTLTKRDLMGRLQTVEHYAGTTATTPATPLGPPAPWGANITRTGKVSAQFDASVPASSCETLATRITDEANNERIHCADGLGRLTGLTEPDGTITNYTYDTLDNLVGVRVQGGTNDTCNVGVVGQQRCFGYSSLSRLTSATNPESGTVSYEYYPGGALKKRTDARGNITQLLYDSLNRVTDKTYTVAGETAATPNVGYTYDPATGLLASVSVAGTPGRSTAYAYDGFGRIATSTQTIAGQAGSPFTFRYSYTLTGQLQQMVYPSGRTINYPVDRADRITAVQDAKTGAYYAGILYSSPLGNMILSLGNGLREQLTVNDRAQLTGVQVATSEGTNLLGLGVWPCASQAAACATGNNGNVQSQTITAPGLSLTQTYTYSNLNQLLSATETGGWSETYQYRNANRWVTSRQGTGLPALTLETPQSSSWFGANNRVATWDYDASGNVKSINNLVRTFEYDAESQQVSATVNGGKATFLYDGEGQRVQKTAPGTDPATRQPITVTTTFVYDAWGNLAAEYSTQPPPSPCVTLTCYVTVDHLGSTRLLTDSTGAAQRRYDYLPFGEEIPAGTNARTTTMGYMELAADDPNNPRYTGSPYRDAESGLDYFPARYYSKMQGRFQSPDPANAGANPSDPQTWNGYAYVSNNPLTYTDPTGEGIFGTIFGVVAGVLTSNPWIGLAAAGVGNGIDVAIWGPGAAGIPGIGYGSGSLTSCGGPLGTCGTLGSGPWSEQSGLGNVQDPNRFIFDLEHAKADELSDSAKQILSKVYANTWPIARPVCSGGGFAYVGPHFGIPKTPLQGEALFIPVDYESGKGFSTGALVEVGKKKSPFSIGGEVSRSWNTGKWSAGWLGFGNKEWNSAKVGPLNGGVLADTHGNVGAYAGTWAGGGVYFRPSFINGCR